MTWEILWELTQLGLFVLTLYSFAKSRLRFLEHKEAIEKLWQGNDYFERNQVKHANLFEDHRLKINEIELEVREHATALVNHRDHIKSLLGEKETEHEDC